MRSGASIAFKACLRCETDQRPCRLHNPGSLSARFITHRASVYVRDCSSCPPAKWTEMFSPSVSVRRRCHHDRRPAKATPDQVQRRRCSGAGQASASCSSKESSNLAVLASSPPRPSRSTPAAGKEVVRLARACSSTCDLPASGKRSGLASRDRRQNFVREGRSAGPGFRLFPAEDF